MNKYSYIQQQEFLFLRLQNKLAPNPALMEKIAEHLKNNIRGNLQSGGVGSPAPWSALSPNYAKHKASTGMIQRILTATGALEQSLYTSYSGTAAAVCTNKPYAALLNYGGIVSRTSRGRKIALAVSGRSQSGKQYTAFYPPRPFMYVTNEQVKMIADEIKEYLVLSSL